jgi:hypothetical protein
VLPTYELFAGDFDFKNLILADDEVNGLCFDLKENFQEVFYCSVRIPDPTRSQGVPCLVQNLQEQKTAFLPHRHLRPRRAVLQKNAPDRRESPQE